MDGRAFKMDGSGHARTVRRGHPVASILDRPKALRLVSLGMSWGVHYGRSPRPKWTALDTPGRSVVHWERFCEKGSHLKQNLTILENGIKMDLNPKR